MKIPAVVALYRYPVKGFAPVACDVLTVLSEGRIAGDRVLAFRFADSGIRTLRIGQVAFDVVKPKARCLATHANPRTGKRDRPVMPTPTKAFAQKEPAFAVGMVSRGAGGAVRVGDEVSLLEG